MRPLLPAPPAARLPAAWMPAALLPLLAACAADCPPGSHRQGDGLCHLDGFGGGPGDTTGDSGRPGDTADATDWVTLPAACEPPADGATDPISLLGEVDIQRSSFVEYTDLALDPARGLAFGAGQGGLVVADVSEPAAPRFLWAGAPHAFFQRFYKVAVGAGGAVYTTHRDLGLVAWDTTDPAAPAAVTTLDLPDAAGMAAADGHLYLATHAGGLLTFDASEPARPRELARLDGLGNAWQPLVHGDRIYVADNTLGIGVVDRSDPARPALIGAVPAAGGVQELAVSGDGGTLYAAAGGAGVQVFSLDDRDAPASVATIPLHYSVISVAVDGDMLWAANQQDVVALDISEPRSPRLVGTHQTRQWAMHVDAAGGVAWVGDWGWLAGLGADASARAADADLSTSSLLMPQEGGTIEVSVANLGSDDLRLTGATVADARVTVRADRDTVPPGQSARLQLSYSGGGGLDAGLCLATNDADEPLQQIALVDGPGGEAGPWLGAAAPDFTLEDLDGERWTLSEQRGHPVVLVYFATW